MTGRDLDPTLLRLLGSNEPEIDCDECFAQLDRYVELEARGRAGRRSSSRASAPISSAVPPAPKSTRACARCSNSTLSPEQRVS